MVVPMVLEEQACYTICALNVRLLRKIVALSHPRFFDTPSLTCSMGSSLHLAKETALGFQEKK